MQTFPNAMTANDHMIREGNFLVLKSLIKNGGGKCYVSYFLNKLPFKLGMVAQMCDPST